MPRRQLRFVVEQEPRLFRLLFFCSGEFVFSRRLMVPWGHELFMNRFEVSRQFGEENE